MFCTVCLVETKEEDHKGKNRRRSKPEEKETRGGAAGSLEMVWTFKVFLLNNHINAVVLP